MSLNYFISFHFPRLDFTWLEKSGSEIKQQVVLSTSLRVQTTPFKIRIERKNQLMKNAGNLINF